MLVLALLACASDPAPEPAPPLVARRPAYAAEPLLPPDDQIPAAASIRAVGDGLVAYCDPLRGEVRVLRAGDLAGTPLAADVGAPVRAARADLDGDGRREWVIADIGILWPSDERVGRVLAVPDGGGAARVLLDGVGRVACAEPGDLDGDGDTDVAVCEFGHVRGGLRWLENAGGTWTSRVLSTDAGWGAAAVVDVDGDRDLDVAAIVSQGIEQVVVWRNDGRGGFTAEILLDAPEPWYGLGGLEAADLDRDGDADLLVANGDTMDQDLPDGVDPDGWYGLAWFANDGAGRFERREILRIWGAYGTRAADLDGDLDVDVALASYQVPQLFPDAPRRPLIWLENDGSERFTPHVVNGAPGQPMAVEVFDADGDGDADLLTGTLYMNKEEGVERLVLLRNEGAKE